MKKLINIMLVTFLAVFTAQAQESPKESAKILNVKYKGKPDKEERKPEFNKYDSSFNKKLSREKKKSTVAKRKRGKVNSRIREMEMHHNKRNVEFARKMEMREIAEKRK
jgi:hypothetical protein